MSPVRQGRRHAVPAALLLLAAATGALAGPIKQLIDSKGSCAATGEIASFVASTGATSMAVVGALGGRGSGKSTLLNRAFGTDFHVGRPFEKEMSAGACAAVVDKVLLLDCDGADAGAAGGVTSAELAAFSAALCDAVIVNVWSSDVGRAVASNQRTLEALFAAKKRSSPPEADKRPLLLLAVHDYDPSVDAEALEAAALQDLEAVWAGVATENDGEAAAGLSDYFAVQVLPLAHPIYQPDAYATSVATLRGRLAAAAHAGPRSPEAVAGALASTWERVKRAGAPAILSPSELFPAYKVATAFADASGEVDASLRRWRAAVGAGRVVGSFGAKAAALKDSVMRKFDAATFAFVALPARAQRRAELEQMLRAGIEDLFEAQVGSLAADGFKAYKKEMLKLSAAEKLNEDSEASLIRKVLFNFETEASGLADEGLGLSIESASEELEADMQAYSDKFRDSPAVQLKALQRVEQKVKKPRQRSIGAGLGLVGMIRQPGFSNLQGFLGYRLGPHSVLFGYANDADPAAEGGASPLLRLQPKLNLDIDL